jgi:serine/threonine-protein kinase RsbW
MPTVEIRFSPLPEHVRTARLLAVAVARRAHVDDSSLDEIRLAVGEACSRAVRLHRRYAPSTPVQLSLHDDDGTFGVDVVDEGPYDAAPADDDLDLVDQLDNGEVGADELAEGLPSGVVLAVISGLVDSVTISPGGPTGTRVHMQWPAGREAADSLTLEERGLELDLPV